ncbi:unnamed protein product [Schistocephalus solidus]|uniref:Uncharacterized protein n=1 Tax=Schistocephalus solidus TaxID=70667 RepID=A0A3P7DE05_SCHSO|nr:unnamed protein product [Schistocephalus solidus]
MARVSPLTLAAWNLRSILDNPRSKRPERRTALVARELARYMVDIAALSDTRFYEQGQLEKVGAGYTFFWSGRPKAERGDASVAFAIWNDIGGLLPCLPQGCNDRLMRLHLPLRGDQFTTIISAYAPQRRALMRRRTNSTRTCMPCWRLCRRRGSDFNLHEGPKVNGCQGAWVIRKAEEIQGYADRNEMKNLFKAIKAINGPRIKGTAPLLSSDRKTLLKEISQILKRWAEHFRSVPTCSSAISDAAIDQLHQVETNNNLDLPPSLPETIWAVQQISSGKTLGSDAIPPEVYKHGGTRLMAELTTLFQEMCRTPSPADQNLRPTDAGEGHVDAPALVALAAAGLFSHPELSSAGCAGDQGDPQMPGRITTSSSLRLDSDINPVKGPKVSDPQVSSQSAHKLQDLQAPDDNATLEARWSQLRNIVQSIVHAVLRCAYREHQYWFDDNDTNRLHKAHTDCRIDANKAAFFRCHRLVQQRLWEMPNAWMTRKANELQ